MILSWRIVAIVLALTMPAGAQVTYPTTLQTSENVPAFGITVGGVPGTPAQHGQAYRIAFSPATSPLFFCL